MSETEKVKVPHSYGDQQVFRFSGSAPKTLRAHDGIVHVPKAHLNQFLSIVKGSKVVGGNPTDVNQQGDK